MPRNIVTTFTKWLQVECNYINIYQLPVSKWSTNVHNNNHLETAKKKREREKKIVVINEQNCLMEGKMFSATKIKLFYKIHSIIVVVVVVECVNMCISKMKPKKLNGCEKHLNTISNHLISLFVL